MDRNKSKKPSGRKKKERVGKEKRPKKKKNHVVKLVLNIEVEGEG